MNKLLCGNNIDLIKEVENKTIDCVITSPPYFNTGKKYQRGTGFHYSSDFTEPLYNIMDIMEAIKPKLKDGGIVCLNLGFSYAETGCMRPYDIVNRLRDKFGYFIVDVIIWLKKNPIPLRNRLTNAYEYIFVLSNSPSITYKNKSHKLNVIHESVASYKGHSAVFPENLVQNLLETFTDENDLVLDCYMGSGTTAFVCKKLNRKYLGFEINNDYVELSKKRLEK